MHLVREGVGPALRCRCARVDSWVSDRLGPCKAVRHDTAKEVVFVLNSELCCLLDINQGIAWDEIDPPLISSHGVEIASIVKALQGAEPPGSHRPGHPFMDVSEATFL